MQKTILPKITLTCLFLTLLAISAFTLVQVSHELRIPIFSLQGFLETLLSGAIDDPAVNRDFLQKAYNHSVRLNTLLGDLISISLKEFTSSLVEEFRPAAENNNVTFQRIPLSDDTGCNVSLVGPDSRLKYQH